MKIKVIEPREKCYYIGCDYKAIFLVAKKLTGAVEVNAYCKHHAEYTLQNDFPEYTTTCPNCQCRMGVN